ncbi:MAG: hypothetical protein J6S67_20455 [Methanobrevibacter sp.]|nr:hypothetical protein [Methanobrevibacter sp.]
MANLTKSVIPIAAEKKTRLNLDCDHVTTMRFMHAQPVWYRHMLAGESINVSALSNVRPAPMPVPTYGRMRQNLRFFFVPYRLCFPQYDSMMADVIGVNYGNSSLVVSPPAIEGDAIASWLKLAIVSSAGTSANHDFEIGGSYYLFTEYGRKAWKVFYSLGYSYAYNKDMKFNALGLLSWAKVMLDWYENSQYLDSATIIEVRKLLAYNNPTTPLSLTASNLNAVLSLGVVTYDSNGYFEAAWDNPVAPTSTPSNQFSSLSFQDISADYSTAAYVGTSANGTPYMAQPSANVINIGTKYIHEALNRLTDYQKRHQLSGAYEIDRFLSQHGFVSNYLRELRSIYVSGQTFDIKVGDIYATATSSDGSGSSQVGDYAGRGFGVGSKSVQFRTDEDGIMIAIATILPSSGYYQGYDRNNRHLTKDAFFNSDFDALSTQSIEKGELYVSNHESFAAPADYISTFGFTGRYGEYKRAISRVSGDISLPTVMAGGNSWHLMREFSDAYWQNDADNIYHSNVFSSGADAIQYHRVFDYTKEDYDPFFCFFHFNVTAISPCRALFDTYDFESLGKEIALQSQGGKVN